MRRHEHPDDVGRFRGERVEAESAAKEAQVIQVELNNPVAPVTPPRAGGPRLESRAGVDLSAFHSVLEKHGIQRVEPSFRTTAAASTEAAPEAQQKGRFLDVHVPPAADTAQVLKDLRALPEVERAVVVPKPIPPTVRPSDPLVGVTDQVSVDPTTSMENQWYVFRCHADQAWGRASGKGVVIIDIDFGFRTSHEDLRGRLNLGRAHNSYDGTRNVSAGGNVDHGTGVMGILGAEANGSGMAGLAFEAELWPVQANAGAGAQLPGDAFANAVEWAITTDSGGKRKVINLEVQSGTYGNYEVLPALNDAIRRAIAANLVVCVAAGNGARDAGLDDEGSPIPPTGSILVAATEYDPSQNRLASFSNFGTRIVVAAPGDADHDVTCSSGADDAYRNRFGGTSGATPKVAATAALMLQVNPQLSHEQVKRILQQTGSVVQTSADKPAGVFLSSYAAVEAALQA